MPDFDFTTSTTVDSLDSVPEQFRSVYEPAADGKFALSATHKGVVEAITGFSKALRAERTQHGELKKQKDVGAAVSEALGALGIKTLDEAKTKLTELTDMVAQNSKVDPKKIKEEIEATFKGEREGYETRIGKMQSTLEKYLVDNEAISALAAAKGSPALLLPTIKSRVKVVADGEDYVVRVLDADGQYRGDGKGGFMGVADLVTELRNHPDYKAAFQSDAPSGGGKRSQTATREAARTSERQSESKSPQDLISAGLASRRRGR